MYESNLVFHFGRLWGYQEGLLGRGFKAPILGNSQNPFDELLGDVAGQSGQRFFLIEFKRERDGFAEEVTGSRAKPHRQALYAHLRNDQDCRKFARLGHWGAYADEQGLLIFEPYAHAVAPVTEQAFEAFRKQRRAEHLAGIAQSWHELDWRAAVVNFDDFHACATDERAIPWNQDRRLFEHGIGIPRETLHLYVQCMYQHLASVETSSSSAVLVMLDPQTKAMTLVMNSVEGLVRDLHSAFEQAARIQPSKVSGTTTRRKSSDP